MLSQKEPYTHALREVFKLAASEAARMGHDYIGVEHWLLGALRKDDCLANKAMRRLSVDAERLRVDVEKAVGFGGQWQVGIRSPNTEAKRALDGAKNVAAELRHGWIGTEHFLLAALTASPEESGACVAAMRAAGVDHERAKMAILATLASEEMPRQRPDEWSAFRADMNQRIMQRGTLQIKRIFSLDNQTYQKGALDEFTKELMGLSASTVLRCDDCIAYHVRRCRELGMTEEQFWEAMNVGLVVGGTIVIPHLRRAVALWDDLEGMSRAKAAEDIEAPQAAPSA
jgi:AhpD family alkylhydroperoxidase